MLLHLKYLILKYASYLDSRRKKWNCWKILSFSVVAMESRTFFLFLIFVFLIKKNLGQSCDKKMKILGDEFVEWYRGSPHFVISQFVNPANFVNFPPFCDFEKKNPKNFRFFFFQCIFCCFMKSFLWVQKYPNYKSQFGIWNSLHSPQNSWYPQFMITLWDQKS